MSKNRSDYGGRGAQAQLKRMYDKYKGICQICFRFVSRRNASREHVIPLWRGGDKSDHNCILACRECNSEANLREIREHQEEYLAYRKLMDDTRHWPRVIHVWITQCLDRQAKGEPALYILKSSSSVHWSSLDDRPVVDLSIV